jgi:RimJ/RimL family protein N-acetyltransferase
MIKGARVQLRPVREEDWSLFEQWAQSREAFWGPYQRFQIDHLPQLREAFRQTGLLKRESGFLIIETPQDQKVIGFVRYTLLQFPDADLPYPEIGYGITDISARGKGFAQEAVSLLIDYLFAGYPAERIAAFTDTANVPSQQVLEKLGFRREGVLRRASFRDGNWCDIAVYSVLRNEWRKS